MAGILIELRLYFSTITVRITKVKAIVKNSVINLVFTVKLIFSTPTLTLVSFNAASTLKSRHLLTNQLLCIRTDPNTDFVCESHHRSEQC